jgi:DNA-binding IclR family transcriptional regulator
MSKGKYYFSKSLEKGLSILSLFNRETPVLTQSQIAKTLALNMTSTYRYINTLVELGYLEKNAKTKEIRPALLSMVLGTNLMRATDHLEMIKDVVDRVHRENNISIDLVFVVDDALVRIYHREAEETLTYRLPDVSRNCLHNTALGKAYLASLTEDQLAAKIASLSLVARTAKTITDRDRLREEIRMTRERRFSMCEEEFLAGLLAIGAPLCDPISGKGVGAVSFDFSVLQQNASEIMIRYADMIRETARALSALLPQEQKVR